MSETADMLGGPGQVDRERSTHEETGAIGHGLAAGSDAQGQADATGGNPTAAKTSDSAGKRGRKMMTGIKRAHGWRVQEGKRDGG